MTGGHPAFLKGKLLFWIDDRDSSNLPWEGKVQFKAHQPFIEKPEFSTINPGWLGGNGLRDFLRCNRAK